MTQFRFYGASDDLVEVEGAITDEFSTPRGKWTGVLVAPNGSRLAVHARYTDRGTWMLGVHQTEDVEPLPPWVITIRTAAEGECRYSVTLVVDAPEGTQLAVSS